MTDPHRSNALAPRLWIDSFDSFQQLWESHTGLPLEVSDVTSWRARIHEKIEETELMSAGVGLAEHSMVANLQERYYTLLARYPGLYLGATLRCEVFAHDITLRPFWKKPTTLIIDHHERTSSYWWGTVAATLLVMRGIPPSRWPPALLSVEGLTRPWSELNLREQTDQDITVPLELAYMDDLLNQDR